LAVGAATSVVVATSGQRVIRPAVAWQDAAPIETGTRSEWLVTWTANGPSAIARRYASSGVALSNAFLIGQGAVSATPAPDGHIYMVSASQSAFESVSLGCRTR
jgi:hypothetical protein